MRYYVCKTGCKASPDLQQFLTFELQENMRDNQTYLRMFLCILEDISYIMLMTILWHCYIIDWEF